MCSSLVRFWDLKTALRDAVCQYKHVTSLSTSTRTLVGRYVAWDWLRTNWYSVTSYWDTTVSSAVSRCIDILVCYYDLHSAVTRIISVLAEDFNTEAELRQLETFHRKHEAELGSAAAAVEQRLESTRANILWVETHYTTLLDWLDQHQQSSNH